MSAAEVVSVNTETGEIVARDFRLEHEPMSAVEAEYVTTDINATTKTFPMKVRAAKRGQVHKALGYATWEEYVDDRLIITRQYADRLIELADKVELIATAIDLPADAIKIPERVLRGADANQLASAAAEAVAELSDPTEAEKVAAAEASTRAEAARQQTERSKAVTEAQTRRAHEALAADPTLEVNALAKVAKCAPEVAADVKAQQVIDEPETETMVSVDAGSPVSDGPPVAPDGQAPAPAPTGEDTLQSSSPAVAEPGQDSPSPAPVPGSDRDEASSAVVGQSGSGEEPVAADDLSATHPLPDDWRDRIARSAQLLGCPVDALRDVLTDDDRIDLTDLRDHLNLILELNS